MIDLLRESNEVIEQVQSEKMRSMLSLCARGHPYYREQWRAAGIDPAKIRTLAELELLPLTPKVEMMRDPEGFRIDLPDLPLYERVLWEVIYTTGTTSDPTPVYNTTHDFHAYLFQARRVAEISGVNAADVIANLFPLTTAPMGAFLRAGSNAYAAGASIFAALPGATQGPFGVHRSLEQAVRAIESHRATVLWGVPSFVRRVLLRAIEIGANFESVRMCAITGEASSLGMREELRRSMRELNTKAASVFDRYGSTELGGFAQCCEEGGWHNPAPEIQYHEVVDPDTGRRLPDGERGALAVTHLDRRGTVLIRFIVGDVVSIAHSPCPHCGRNGDRIIGPVVRTKDLVKVKGMLINPVVLLDSLQGLPGVDELQVLIRRTDLNDAYSMDEILVRVATQRTDRAMLSAQISDDVQRAIQVRPRVEYVRREDIYDPGTETKAKRFIDER
ncbi:MAG: AMP-binding protein [Variovorax sp.]